MTAAAAWGLKADLKRQNKKIREESDDDSTLYYAY
jgi:hypothetical protein